MKSRSEVYLQLFCSLLMDAEALTGISVARDRVEIQRRTNHEGLSFLTKTLPSFAKHVLACVEREQFTPIAGYKKRRKGPLPLFLGGLVDCLFETDGSLKTDRWAPALGHIEQICTFMYKCEFPYTQEQTLKRLTKFKEVEKELPEKLGRFPVSVELAIANAMDFAQTLHRDFSIMESLPKHGPGAVAGREKAQEKYVFQYNDQLDEHFPWEDWFQTYITSETDHYLYGDDLPKVTSEELFLPQAAVENGLLALHDDFSDTRRFEISSDLPPARGIFVNKDSRGPRYISAEPKELMWLQQALGSALQKWYEKHPLSRGILGFTDQTVNQRLAVQASIDGQWATLDMEDASDRVSLALVREILPTFLVRKLEACRSSCAVLPDGELVHLKKFAPMGSACCFPIESVIFLSLAVGCIEKETGWDHERAIQAVRVYGDDIIVRKEFVEAIFETFEQVNLKFNRSKSFVNGPFRESCGSNAIDGLDITPIKLRKPAPKSATDVTSIISWVDTSNQMYYAGYWKTADTIARIVSRTRRQKLQYVPYQSGCLGLTGLKSAFSVPKSGIKWDKNVQRLKIRVQQVKMPSTDWSENTVSTGGTLHTLVKGSPSKIKAMMKGRNVASTLSTDLSGILSLRKGYRLL